MGWHGAVFAGQRKLKPLEEYLRSPAEKSREGARKLLALAKSKMKRKE
jgi:hypothetical protein